MATRNVVLTDAQPDLRARLNAGLEEARRGELAEGSGEDAVRRAFSQARTGS